MEFPGANGTTDNLSVRRSEITAGITFQHEVVDPLWISFELGMRKPLALSVFDPSAPRTTLSRTSISAASYFSTSLFLVPPKKLLKKLMKPRKPKL